MAVFRMANGRLSSVPKRESGRYALPNPDSPLAILRAHGLKLKAKTADRVGCMKRKSCWRVGNRPALKRLPASFSSKRRWQDAVGRCRTGVELQAAPARISVQARSAKLSRTERN
jgi:hypothetical protein